MLAFSNDYYGLIFRATQSVELFCAYEKSAPKSYTRKWCAIIIRIAIPFIFWVVFFVILSILQVYYHFDLFNILYIVFAKFKSAMQRLANILSFLLSKLFIPIVPV